MWGSCTAAISLAVTALAAAAGGGAASQLEAPLGGAMTLAAAVALAAAERGAEDAVVSCGCGSRRRRGRSAMAATRAEC